MNSSDTDPENIESWLSDVENYEGTIEDETGTTSVAVTVGPEKEATSVTDIRE